MANTKTMKMVYDALKECKEPVSPSSLTKLAKSNYKPVMECIELMEYMDIVNTMKSSAFTLVWMKNHLEEAKIIEGYLAK